MLARRAKCFLVLTDGVEDGSQQEKAAGGSAKSSADADATDDAAADAGADGDDGHRDGDRPAGCVGLVNLFQSNDKAQAQVVVVLDGVPDGDYLVAFTYAPENMTIYNKILKQRVAQLPKRRPYEEPRPKAEAPATVNTIGKELCPDQRVLGAIKVEKSMGTLILSDDRFSLFDYIWTPVDGTFIVSRGASKLGDAHFPAAGTEVATGRVEMDLNHFQSRRDEAALQDAMRPRSMQELLRGTKTSMPLSKAMPLLMAGENRAAFRTLGRFSFAMFLAPLLVFLVVRILAAEHQYKDIMSGGAAILTVNIVIGLYALQAYQENVAEQREVDRLDELKAVRQRELDRPGELVRESAKEK